MIEVSWEPIGSKDSSCGGLGIPELGYKARVMGVGPSGDPGHSHDT